jgi:hypothetical protein
MKYTPLNRQSTPRLHGAISQKALIFMPVAVKTLKSHNMNSVDEMRGTHLFDKYQKRIVMLSVTILTTSIILQFTFPLTTLKKLLITKMKLPLQ